MSWFEKLMPSRISTEKRTRSVPEGVWIKCQECDAQLYRTELERNLYVCPKCDHHMRIGADRLADEAQVMVHVRGVDGGSDQRRRLADLHGNYACRWLSQHNFNDD